MQQIVGSLLTLAMAASSAFAGEADGQATAIDGDTLQMGTETIRLEGIDAPELSQRCIDGQGRQYPGGRRSKFVLANLLKAGPIQCLESGKDRYGRSLAYCSAGAVDINATMVRQGWAITFVKYSRRYSGIETAAKAAKTGLWAGALEAPWDYRAGAIAAAPAGPSDCVIKGNINRRASASISYPSIRCMAGSRSPPGAVSTGSAQKMKRRRVAASVEIARPMPTKNF